MKIIFIGDIFAKIGKRICAEQIPVLREEFSVDIFIANAENIAGGRGMTVSMVKKLRKFGVHVITGGNHSFANPDIFGLLNSDPSLLRPMNFPDGNPGRGVCLFRPEPDSKAVGVVNIQGRTFLHESLECPFRSLDKAIEELQTDTSSIIVDFHAETTSEKRAMFFHCDGRVSALLGTHTHVQTADECISDAGTAYITDVGMTGPESSAIGMKPEGVVRRFLLQTPVRFEPSEQKPMMNAIFLNIDDSTGRVKHIERIYRRVQLTV